MHNPICLTLPITQLLVGFLGFHFVRMADDGCIVFPIKLEEILRTNLRICVPEIFGRVLVIRRRLYLKVDLK